MSHFLSSFIQIRQFLYSNSRLLRNSNYISIHKTLCKRFCRTFCESLCKRFAKDYAKRFAKDYAKRFAKHYAKRFAKDFAKDFAKRISQSRLGGNYVTSSLDKLIIHNLVLGTLSGRGAAAGGSGSSRGAAACRVRKSEKHACAGQGCATRCFSSTGDSVNG